MTDLGMKTIAIISLATVMGCTLFEEIPEWDISEPEREEEDVGVCPQVDDDWAHDDFVIGLYYYVACRRAQNDNFVFSPVAIRLALGEWAREDGGDDGDALARRLGYDNGWEMYERGEEYRAELLERRPIPYQVRGRMSSDYTVDVDFEEEDPERLQRALGIQFYGIECPPGAAAECAWNPLDDRWEDDDFFDGAPPRTSGKSERTAAMILRGQWAGSVQLGLGVLHFTDVDGNLIDTRDIHSRGRHYDTSDGIHVYEWLFVGNQISVIFIGAPDRSIQELENQFSSRSIGEWMDPIENASHYSDQKRLLVPAFDIEDTVDVSGHFDVEDSLSTTTRVDIFDRGTHSGISVLNSAERLSKDADWSPIGRAAGAPTRERELLPRVNFDSPFLFIVYDRPTETVLKIGRVSRP